MLCLACASRATVDHLCTDCHRSLRLAPIRLIGSVSVQPVFHHIGAAVRLVHNLKYRRSRQAGLLLGSLMAARLPTDATSLVPIPRVLSRRIAYGIDQTAVLASVIADICGLPIVNALGSPVWNRRSAGRDRVHRQAPGFSVRSPVGPGAVLVDDVCTTGATIVRAAAALGVDMSSLVATSAGSMGAGAVPAAPRR